MTESPTSDQIFIRKLTAIVLANPGNKTFGVKELAHESGMSLYSLNRKLNSINKKTINQFIREVRLQKALEMLKNESLTANEIAYNLGFSSPAYFNLCFKEFFGYPPGQIKKSGLKDSEDNILIEVSASKEHKRSASRAMIFTFSGIVILLVLTLIFIDPGHLINFRWNSFKYLRSSSGRISVVVMPFQNMSNDSTLNYLKEWIPESATSYLSNYSEDLEVRQTESTYSMIKSKRLSNNASITPSVASLISQKLDANIVISGNLIKTSTGIIVNTNIINSKTEEVLKSFQEEGNPNEIIQKIDILSQKIKDYLIISKLKKGLSPEAQRNSATRSPEALRHYIMGGDALRNGDNAKAVEEYSKTVRIDSNFTSAYIGLIISFARNGMGDDSSIIYCRRIYKKIDQMTPIEKLQAEFVYNMFLGKSPYDALNCLKQLIKLDDQQPVIHSNLGYYYMYLPQPDRAKSISEYEKSLEIYKKWGIKPEAGNYADLGNAFHATKQYKKEEKVYKKAEIDFPDDPGIRGNEFKLALALKDTVAANNHLKKFMALSIENSVPAFNIAIDVADMYESENYHEKTEEYIKKSLKLPLDYSGLTNCSNFAWFLIDEDRDVNGGLKLVDKALEFKPDVPANLDSKGWGLYKQGKYKEALEFLQKADSLNPNKFNHIVNLHIEAVNKAIASQK